MLIQKWPHASLFAYWSEELISWGVHAGYDVSQPNMACMIIHRSLPLAHQIWWSHVLELLCIEQVSGSPGRLWCCHEKPSREPFDRLQTARPPLQVPLLWGECGLVTWTRVQSSSWNVSYQAFWGYLLSFSNIQPTNSLSSSCALYSVLKPVLWLPECDGQIMKT